MVQFSKAVAGPLQIGSIRTAGNDNQRPDESAAVAEPGSGARMRTVRFSNEAAERMTDWASSRDVSDLAGPRLFQTVREGARIIETIVDRDIRETLNDVAAFRLDALVVRNLYAVRDLEPTVNDRDPSPASRKYAFITGALSMRCGSLPTAVTSENNAAFDRHVVRKDGLAGEKRSDGGGEIGPHSEHASKGHGDGGLTSPAVDTICLGGLRNPGAEPTGFALLADALPSIPKRYQEVLEMPIFGSDPPDSSSSRETVWNLPILTQRRGRLEIAYRDDKVQIPDRDDAREAVNSLRTAIRKAARSVVLSPGTAWLAFNPRTLHWRDPVRNKDRWLIRTFGFAASTAVIVPNPERPEIVEY